MKRASFLAFVLAVSAGASAWADVPLPKDLKYVDPRVRFEGVESHADRVFYLRFLSFTGSPASVPFTLREVKDDKAFNLKAQRRLSGMSLIALERKDFEKRAKDDPSLKWLNDKTEGALHASVPLPSTVGSIKDKETPVTSYRVNIKDGKLNVELTSKDKSRGDATPGGLLPLWAFGLISALSLAGFGVWMARRTRTPR